MLLMKTRVPIHLRMIGEKFSYFGVIESKDTSLFLEFDIGVILSSQDLLVFALESLSILPY